MLKILLKSLRASDWSQALDFVSPSFFKVIQAQTIIACLQRLRQASGDADRTEAARVHWQTVLSRLSPLWQGPLLSGRCKAVSTDKLAMGQHLLELYFASILSPSDFFLDLRSSRFCQDETMIQWYPQAWITSWSADFRINLMDIYAGFYLDDHRLFQDGLAALGLAPVESAILNIFGSARSSAQRFKLADFQNNFHSIFVSCREHSLSLQADFLMLGILLFGLYEHAEHLEVELFPSTAFHKIYSARELLYKP